MQDVKVTTLTGFIAKHMLAFQSHQVESRPDGLMNEREMRHWRVRITNPAKAGKIVNGQMVHGSPSFSLYFSQGLGITEDPTLADVLDCIANDASGYDNTRGFEDWASDYGYDADSRSAEKIYRAIKRQAEQLKRTIGDAAYAELLYDVERL